MTAVVEGHAPERVSARRQRETLSQRVERIGVPKRDCRTCPMFDPDPDGFAFGWCRANKHYVKLYHPPGDFYSQCQFKVLSRAKPAPANAVID